MEWTEKGIEWYRAASEVQDKLLDFTQESHIVKKLEVLNLLGDKIKEWARINNQKMYDWYWLYEKGISEWLKEFEGSKELIIKGIKEKEPLGENVYRPNKKLYSRSL